jgi:hypothetical protein
MHVPNTVVCPAYLFLSEPLYMQQNVFQIISNTGSRTEKYYSCCPEPYVDLKFELIVQKKFKITENGIIRNPHLYTPPTIKNVKTNTESEP